MSHAISCRKHPPSEKAINIQVDMMIQPSDVNPPSSSALALTLWEHRWSNNHEGRDGDLSLNLKDTMDYLAAATTKCPTCHLERPRQSFQWNHPSSRPIAPLSQVDGTELFLLWKWQRFISTYTPLSKVTEPAPLSQGSVFDFSDIVSYQSLHWTKQPTLQNRK